MGRKALNVRRAALADCTTLALQRVITREILRDAQDDSEIVAN